MKKRGKILRDPRTGPGLIMIEGRQYWFREDVWKSEVPFDLGLIVEVTLDHAGQIVAITAASQSQPAEVEPKRVSHKAIAAGAKLLRKIFSKCGVAI